MVNVNGVGDNMLKRNKKIVFTICLVSLLQANIVLAKSTLTTTGDVLQIALPVAAFGTAFLKDDIEGEKEFAKSFLVNVAITNGLKLALKGTDLDKRPNGGHYSFPSGHSSAAFGGAFFLQKRYGTEYGAPAIALAAVTGYSRIKSKHHHWRDVIGGVVIALGTNYFMVNEYVPKDLAVAIDKDSVMLDMKLSF